MLRPSGVVVVMVEGRAGSSAGWVVRLLERLSLGIVAQGAVATRSRSCRSSEVFGS